jgi:membrane protease YdiL (CAAX protease family)
MWCPALAAMATLKLRGRRLSELGWSWPATNYALLSWALPLLYTFIAYAIVWSFGLGGFPNRQFMNQLGSRMGLAISPTAATALYVLLGGSFGLARGLASALGEEIGWRGFLVPELFGKLGFTGAALVSGVVWSCWHYPLLIWGDYNSGTPVWYGLACFTVMVVSLSFVFAWMRLKSGSLWTAALLHASHNLYIQGIFTPLTSDTGKTAWYIDEFGAVLPLLTVLLGFYAWHRRGELDSGRPA